MLLLLYMYRFHSIACMNVHRKCASCTGIPVEASEDYYRAFTDMNHEYTCTTCFKMCSSLGVVGTLTKKKKKRIDEDLNMSHMRYTY